MRRRLPPLAAASLAATMSACAAPSHAPASAIAAPIREAAAMPAAPIAPAAHAAPMPPIPIAAPHRLAKEDRTCLVAALYYEARGEGEDGMIAVGHVVLNRLDARPPGTSICDVVYERGQFGWTRRVPRKRVAIGKTQQWKSAAMLADRLAAGRIADKTGGATSFYSTIQFKKGPPRWARNDEETVRIGNHVFLK